MCFCVTIKSILAIAYSHERNMFRISHRKCSTNTSITEPCRVQNVSDMRVMCIFKNLTRVHMSCPFQCYRVRTT